MYRIVFLSFIFLVSLNACNSGGSSSSGGEFSADTSGDPLPQLFAQSFGPEALFPNGIEPGDASQCEAPSGNRCWYVYSQASSGGDGSFGSPFRSFEEVAGYEVNNDYTPGLLRGGDYLYVRGTFSASNHNPRSSSQKILLARPSQGGSLSRPTIIKSWRGFPRAVFDGEYQYIDMIGVRGLGGNQAAVRIQNIEFTRGLGRAISVADGVGHADLIGIVGHKTQGNGIMGTGGVVNFDMRQGVTNFSVMNSLFYQNNINPTGHPNNIGAVGITSEKTAEDGSNIEVAFNVFQNEENAIRQKHSGNIRMEAHNNKISDCVAGFHLRAFENQVRSNLIENVKVAFRISEGNTNGDTLDNISSNEINNARHFITKIANTDFIHEYRVFDNTFTSDNAGIVFNMGEFSNIDFNPEYWQSARNVFNVNSSTFLIIKGKKYDFSSAMETLNDTSSQQR